MARKHRNRKQTTPDSATQATTNTSGSSARQRFWATVGYISIAIGISVVVFQVGQHFGFQSARKHEFKHFVEYIDQIKSGVKIASLSCNTEHISPGGTCELALSVVNETPYECDLWVGASAVDSEGNEIWNIAQDRLVTISPSGVTGIKRFLTFPSDAKPDTYDIQVNLWFGKRSDPSQSERISSASIRKQLTVVKKGLNQRSRTTGSTPMLKRHAWCALPARVSRDADLHTPNPTFRTPAFRQAQGRPGMET